MAPSATSTRRERRAGSGAGNTTGSGNAAGTGAGNTTGAAGTGHRTAGTGTAGASGTGNTGGTIPPPGSPSMLDLTGSPQYYRLVRLTNAQWARAVQDVLKLASPSGLEANFQGAVTGTTDFSNNELVLDVNQRSWTDFQTAAETLAAQVTATDAALAKVYSGTDAAGFITTLGRRVYRRPLTTAEQSTYMTLFNSGASLTGSRSAFAKGASLVIRAMLQSPYFLYRTEMGANNAALSGYEMAAKLSLWLRGTTPSDALLDSVATAKLDTADGAAALATTMLGETTATTVMRQFHSELLRFAAVRGPQQGRRPDLQGDDERRVPRGLQPVLRQDLHAGVGTQGDPDLDERVRRPQHRVALRHDGARPATSRRTSARSASAGSRRCPT